MDEPIATPPVHLLSGAHASVARPDVFVVVPAYNEGAALGGVLAELTRLPYRIIVVDDGSTDDTGAQARRFGVCVLRHLWNLGQGAALQTGFSYALRQPETKVLVTFDADGQHSVDDVARLVDSLESDQLDVVLGSRFADGAAAIDLPVTRRITLQLAIAFTKLTTGLRLTDTHNGMRAFTAAAIQKLTITQNRMAHASEILSRVAQLGLRYREVPVTVRYTNYSAAKGQGGLNAVAILWDIAMSRIR